jgi:hypothetical protein
MVRLMRISMVLLMVVLAFMAAYALTGGFRLLF